MTWTKTGVEFANECANDGLSDAAYRTHHEAIIWVYSVEQMSLRIPKRLVRRFAGSENYADACLELVSVGYWRDHSAEWEIVHHAAVIRQSIFVQRSHREGERLKKQRQRSKRKPRDVPGGQTRGTNRGDVHRDTDSQSSTSLSVSEVEVPARANGQVRSDEGTDLTSARTYLGDS